MVFPGKNLKTDNSEKIARTRRSALLFATLYLQQFDIRDNNVE